MYCGMYGANVKCDDSDCPQSFHFSCAGKKNLPVRFMGQFRALCDSHSDALSVEDTNG